MATTKSLSAIYYVYIHRDILGNVILVGKGKTSRVTNKNGRPTGWKSVVHSYQIIKSNMEEIEALRLESELIRIYSSIKLLNIAKGHKTINLEMLKEYLEYSEDSPTFLIWKKCTTRGKGALTGVVGGSAGCIYKGTKSYKNAGVVSVGKAKNVMIHRLVWALHNGVDSMDFKIVDHIDGNSLNNNINNLRLVTDSVNQKNRKAPEKSTTGHCGITWSDKKQGYRVRFTLNSGKEVTKWISLIKLSKEEALSSAIAYKIENKEILIANGYSERYIYGN